MELSRIQEIVGLCTAAFRKGPEATVDGQEVSPEELKARLEAKIGGVYELFGFPPEEAVKQNGEIKMVDCHFISVAVRTAAAERTKSELLHALKDAGWPKDREVSYIEAGGLLGDQTLALQLFALGEVCGFWRVLTPAVVLGDKVPKEVADKLAGRGFVTTSGFKSEEAGDPDATAT